MQVSLSAHDQQVRRTGLRAVFRWCQWSLTPHLRGWLRLIAQRVAQSFRLMVGVQDYGNYVNHMRRHHPETTPMSEREFHRYCLDARFPSKAGKLGKCPC